MSILSLRRHSSQPIGTIRIGQSHKPKRVLSFSEQQELRQAIAKLYAAIECTSSASSCFYGISEAHKIIRAVLKSKA